MCIGSVACPSKEETCGREGVPVGEGQFGGKGSGEVVWGRVT